MRRSMLFLGGIAAGWLTVGLGLGVLPVTPMAFAVTCDLAGTGYTAFPQSLGTQYGSRASALVAVDTTPSCAQVRSVQVFVDSNNFTEVGEFIDPTGLLNTCQVFTHPHFLAFAQVGGTSKCKQNPPVLTGGVTYNVRVQNPQHNNTMHYFLGSTDEGFHNVNFNQGFLQSFDERHNSGDSLRADVGGLKYMNSAGTWNPWPDQGHNYTGPPTSWIFCEISAIHYVVQNSPC